MIRHGRSRAEWRWAGFMGLLASAAWAVHILLILGLLWFAPAAALAADAAKPPAVLDTYSYWRGCIVSAAPVYAKTAAEVKVTEARPGSPPPPANWTGPDFPDAEWHRTSGPIYGSYGWLRRGGTADVGLICLRGKFCVADPEAAKGLSLSAAYRGGVVVYLNGKEVARGYLGDGKIAPLTPAQEYPLEAYVGPDGKSILYAGALTDEQKRRLELRIRRLDGVALPAEGLRKGVNVLAVELHRSPIDPDRKGDWQGLWGSPGLLSLHLSAASGAEPNLVRPKGLQVWNADPMTAVFDMDYGDPNEPLRPIRLIGARNGAFSGQVVVSSDAGIEKVQARMSDLVLGKGEESIPAGAVRLRYALPTGGQSGDSSLFRGVYNPARFDALAESPPASVKVAAKSLAKGYVGLAPVPGAVQPIWITVQVPGESAAGDYAGKLTLSADGFKPMEVPIELRVADWVAPSPKEFASHVGIVQSPESVGLYYKTPLWSEEHWKLVARSMRCLGEAGCNAIFLPLVARSHFGKEPMVRWIKQADGGYTYDFTIFDRYVDLALEHMGRPQVACLYAWEPVYAAYSRENRKEDTQEKNTAPVYILNPQTKEVSEMKSPFYAAPEAADFFKPVLAECREHLLKRGVPAKALMIGMASDRHPLKEEVETFRKAAPWATWVKQAHQNVSNFSGVPVGHLAFVWGATGLKDPSVKRGQGWQQEWVRTIFPRAGACRGMRSEVLFSDCWNLQEYLVAAGYRGVGRVGADFWPVFKGANRHYGGATIAGAYAEWGQTTISESCLDLLCPGPEGALTTLRLESYRQGVLEAEARIVIEKALADQAKRAKLGDDLAKRAQDLLDGRARIMLAYESVPEWYHSAGWQARTEKLFTAAAEVAKASKTP